MAANPIIPRNALDPSAQFGNLRRANNKLKARYRNIQRGMRDLIKSIDKRVVPEDQGGVVANVKYEYLIDLQKFNEINLFIHRLLYGELLDSETGALSPRWWLHSNLEGAFTDGTTDALRSAQRMATVDTVGRELSQEMRQINIEQIIFSRPYQNRIGLLQARVFESMKGLSDSSKSDLGGTLARGMNDGDGVQVLTKKVMDRVGVSHGRAKRIVRTELLNAYRTASRAETRTLNDDVYSGSDWHMQSLWFSALSPTTRRNHASRHGVVHSPSEDEEFYSKNGESVNCLCSQSPILINRKTKEVLQEDLLKRMKKQKELFR